METTPPHSQGRMRPSLVTARDAVCAGVGELVPAGGAAGCLLQDWVLLGRVVRGC